MEPEWTGRDRPVSAEVCTVMPVGEPSVAAPIVMPVMVMVMGEEAGTAAADRVSTRDVFDVGCRLNATSCALLAAAEAVMSGAKNACG